MTTREQAAARTSRSAPPLAVPFLALIAGMLVAACGTSPALRWIDNAALAQAPTGPNSADTPPGSDGLSAPARPLREIHVPRQRIDEWLRTGDWTPIGADDYRALKAAEKRAAESPPPTRIERAFYEATLIDRALRNGTLSLTMARSGTRPALHSLEPHSFALTELAWAETDDENDAKSDTEPREAASIRPTSENRSAAWGTDSEGRTQLLVDRPRGTARGRWTHAGRRLARGASFELSLPPAASSSLLLRVPTGFRLVAAAADIRGPQPDRQAGWSLWHVDLGSRNQTRLDVVAVDEPDRATERPLVQSDVVWDVREDGLRYAAAFEIESDQATARELEFELPADLTVHRVTSGTDARLVWTTRLNGNRQRIVLPPLEATRGRSRTVRFEATAPIRLNERWTLPRVDLIGGLFVEGRATLRVESPLEIQSLAPRGLIQTGVAIDGVQAESVQLRQDVAAAELSVNLGYPSPALTTRVLSELTRVDDHWVCRSDVEWRAVAAGTFQVAAEFPRDWDVLEVRADGEKEVRFKWDVTRGDTGRRLVLEFAEPLTPAAPRLVTVVLRQLRSVSEGTLDLPVLRPEGASPRHAVLVPPDAGGPPDAAVSGKAAAEALVEFERFPLAVDLRARGGATPRVVLWSQTRGAEGLRWRESTHAVRARVWVTADLASNPLRESIVCQFDPAGRSFDRVHVWLSGSFEDGPRAWELADEQREVAAERLATARHADWGLPGEGELWRITLPEPRSSSFRLRTEGVLARSSLFSPALVFVPEATQFVGHVQINSPSDRRFDLQARGLLPLTVPAANAERERLGLPPAVVNRAWRYESPADRLHVAAAAVDDAPPATLQCRVQSTFADGSGDDLHTAHFRQCGGKSELSVEFHLPMPARLIAARVDGRIVAARPGLLAGGDPGSYVVPIPEGRVWKHLVVEYATPGGASGLWLIRDVVVPRLDRPTIDFRWMFSLPGGARPEAVLAAPRDGERSPAMAGEQASANAGSAPEGLAWVVRPLSLSWRERLFGPFGRHAAAPVFDPRHPLASFDHQRDDTNAADVDPTYVMAGASPPASIRLVAGRIPAARSLGLALLLTTLLTGLWLRRAGSPSRGLSAAVALVVSMVVAFLFSETIGVVAGGVFCGVLLTMIVPRRLIVPRDPTRPRKSDVPTGSTATFRHAAVGAALLLAAGLVATGPTAIPALSADDPGARDEAAGFLTNEPRDVGATRPDDRGDRTDTRRVGSTPVPAPPDDAEAIDVLIPYEGDPTSIPAAGRDAKHPVDTAAAARVVYVPKAVARASRGRNGVRSNEETLVRLVSGEARVGDDLVRVALRFVVETLGRGGPVRVPLRLRDFSPVDGDACRVDGKPVPMEFDAARGYSIRLDPPAADASPTTRSVELVGFARVRFDSNGAERSAALDLPRGPAAPVGWIFPANVVVLDARSSRSETNGSHQAVRWDDRSPPAAVRWHGAAGKPASRTELELRLSRFVEVAPSSLEVHNRIAVKVLRGALDDVSWPIPENVVVRKVTGDDVHSWSVTTSPAGVRRLVVEFTRPQSAEFRVDVVFLVPIAPDGPVTVEPWDIEPDDDARLTARLVLRQIALAPRSGYRLNAPVIESETTRSINVDAFLRGANDWDEARRAVAAWQLYESAAIPVALTSLAPKKTVRTVQETALSPRDALIRLRGEIATAESTEFRHTLHVDSRVQIESIGVREDQADRLARWTRVGDRLVVTLDAGTSGTQDFTLVGRVPLATPSDLTLPLLRFEDAAVAEARLTISASPELEATIVEPGPLVAAPGDAPTSGRLASADTLDGGARLVGRFAIAGDGEPKLRIARVADRARAEIVSTFAVENGQTVWTAAMRFTGLRGPDDARLTLRGVDHRHVRVRATPDVKAVLGVEPVKAAPDGATSATAAGPSTTSPAATDAAADEPATRVEFPELPDGIQELRVDVTATLTPPVGEKDDKRVETPDATGRGPLLPTVESTSRVAGHWLVVPRSQPWTLERDSAAPAAIDDLPAWHALPALEADVAPPVYRLDAAPRRLALRESTAREAPDILAAQTEILWPSGQPPFARTVWRIVARGAPLTLALPDGAVLRRLLADGEPLATTPADAGRVRVSLPVDHKQVLVELDWLPEPEALPRFGRRRLAVPALDARHVSPHALVLRVPRNHPVRLLEPAKPARIEDALKAGRLTRSADDWIQGVSPLAAALDRSVGPAAGLEEAGAAALLDAARPPADLRTTDRIAAPSDIEYRTFDARWEVVPLLFAAAAVVGFAARWLLRVGVVAWVHRRRSAAAAALGLLWWLAFQASVVGFGLFAGALVHAVVQFLRPRSNEIHVG